ncbi:unnamed protein product [Effrenium voratum]|nr:unnamed protein product [Effrenium voratum]
MQKRWRGSRARRKYRVMRGAAVQVQALLRTLRSASEFQKRLQQHREARAALLTAEAELPSLRSGLAAADEQLPEERCVPAEKDMELIQLEDKWKQAAHFEREYGKAKVLIADYEKELGKAALAVSGDASQTKALQQQLEKYHQELRTIRMERDDAQHKLDENESAGEFFKERYRTAQDELRQLKQENAHLSATTDKLKQRLQNAAQSDDVLGTGLDSQESMQKIQKLTDEMKRVQAWGMKSKQLADCLNQLLALESAQTKLYEQTCDIKDFGVIGEIQRRKDQAEAIRRQCDQLMSNSIA